MTELSHLSIYYGGVIALFLAWVALFSVLAKQNGKDWTGKEIGIFFLGLAAMVGWPLTLPIATIVAYTSVKPKN